jgi:hypothetical protein
MFEANLGYITRICLERKKRKEGKERERQERERDTETERERMIEPKLFSLCPIQQYKWSMTINTYK